ncbi:MAG: hypothetical protein A2086_06245 [Spirochaetes bacterium GWD1_27_9]|nr:MAG: hypothetical protein A2Z98_16900 [Spirochaetes bacterium GWB1_27_13]OHD27854.1 MAG: hypothetical protein A2Y34_15640 [Spirochaetes bacterium GWC1_27_15]OHD30866.1 MAG: hypothetical protein A2086_06245 [Spirochaetes bacterium GWD1_27_9]
MDIKSIFYEKVINEINLLPANKLSEIYDFIHYFRLGLQNNDINSNDSIKYAGCWQDMDDNSFNDLINEVYNNRKKAFLERRNNDTNFN